MILPAERLAAYVAGVGPLVRMCPLVDEEVVALGEAPVAELADELLLGPLAGGPPRDEGGGRGRLDRRELAEPQAQLHGGHTLARVVVVVVLLLLDGGAAGGQQGRAPDPLVQEGLLLLLVLVQGPAEAAPVQDGAVRRRVRGRQRLHCCTIAVARRRRVTGH